MPKYLVFFSGPVVDQPDHVRVARPIPVDTPLVVQANDPVSACFHAARVTRGDAHPVSVYTAEGRRVWGEGPTDIDPVLPTPALVETPKDRTEVFGA